MKSICFQMNRKAMMVMLLSLIMAFPALAQKITVHGTVVDSAGEPLIGASVIPEGTTSGAATDFDGKFTLQVAPNAVLSVSYVGYETKKVPVNGQTNLNIVLEESGVTLSEVVAIGYGTVKRTDATGAVSTVKPSEIEAGISTSVQDMLVGQAPGVVVTTSAGPEGAGNIRVRGGSSLNASNDPLIVLDGVPLENSIQGMGNPLSMISPDNVESMTILKDASATAIYGSRASNGVIIINTKRGRGGKPQINFSASMGVQTARKKWKTLDGPTYAEMIRNYWGPSSAAAKALGDANTNFQDEVLRTSISSDYNLSVGGKLNWLPYRVAVTYTNNNGIIKKSQMNRATAGITVNPTLFDEHLQITASVKGYYVRNTFVDTGGIIGSALQFNPTFAPYTDYPMAAGSWGMAYNGYTTWLDDGHFNTNATLNPLAILNDRNNVADVWRSTGNLQLDYKMHFLPELKANLNVGYDIASTDEYNDIAQNSPVAWKNNNHDYQEKNNAAYGSHYFVHAKKVNTLLDFYLNYKKDFKDIYSVVDVTAGYSWQRFKNSGWNNCTVYTTYGFYPTTISDGKYVLNAYKETEKLIGQQVVPNKNSADGNYYWENCLQLVSFFGRVNYTFMDRYLATVTVRRDGSSRFSKDNRWGIFPAVALGWKITEEGWMKDVRGNMNELKLRLGWGETGQQDIPGSLYPYLPTYQIANPTSYYPNITTGKNWAPTIYPNGYNPDIKWETTTTWNAGFDFGFWNNRLAGSIEYYYRKTTDLISKVPVEPGYTTTNELYRNIGSLTNTGIELGLTARPVQTDDLNWTLTYNITWNKNKITQLNVDGSNIPVGGISSGTGGTCQVHSVGHPANSFYLYEQVYDKAGKPVEGVYVDQNGDGVINTDDKVIRKSPDPKVIMSFGTTVNWKNWDFGINLRASIGNYIYIDRLASGTSLKGTYGNSHLTNLLENDFYFNGTGTSDLSLSDYWLRNGSYLRCDNISVGYTWNNLLKNQLKLRVYGAVQNPFVITKYKGIDPEIFGGIDNAVYPRPVTFNLGLVATF